MITARARLFTALLIACLLVGFVSAPAQAALAHLVTPGTCYVKPDWKLFSINGGTIVDFNSRTLLPAYKHLRGFAPATIRLSGGRGDTPLPEEWRDYVARINAGNPLAVKYINHLQSGIVNFKLWTFNQLVFETQPVNVLRVSGNKAYIETFHVDQRPPAGPSDIIQVFTVITSQNTIINTPKGVVYVFPIARRGETLWIDTVYLDCPSRLPKTVTVQTWPQSLNIRQTPGGQWLDSYPSGAVISILATTVSGSDVWGRTDRGWVALYYGGRWYTDWRVTP